MKATTLIKTLLFCLLFSISFTLYAKAGIHSITLVYSGNLDGELEPCGCSEGGNKGGLKRRATVIDELRKKDPDMYLISAGGLITSEIAQDKIKAEYILKGMAALNYDAIGVQWKDLAYGTDFIAHSKLPFVLSNSHSSKFLREELIKHDHSKILFFSWLDPKSDPQRHMGDPIGIKSTATLLKALKNAKQQHQTTILSTTLPLKVAQKTFDLTHVDILIVKARYEKFGKTKKVGDTLILQPGSRGMRIGKLTLQLDNRGMIKQWNEQVIPLPPAVKDAKRMLAWYAAYNNAVKADYEKRVAIQKKLKTGKSPYAGAEACKTCHLKEYNKWNDSRHAQAFYDLQDVNKAFDPECIKCHTVGFEKKGGFIDPMITANLQNVQCENCHGAARAHAESAGRIKTENTHWKSIQMCHQCHVEKHSPDFNFKTYWPKIAHGK